MLVVSRFSRSWLQALVILLGLVLATEARPAIRTTTVEPSATSWNEQDRVANVEIAKPDIGEDDALISAALALPKTFGEILPGQLVQVRIGTASEALPAANRCQQTEYVFSAPDTEVCVDITQTLRAAMSEGADSIALTVDVYDPVRGIVLAPAEDLSGCRFVLYTGTAAVESPDAPLANAPQLETSVRAARDLEPVRTAVSLTPNPMRSRTQVAFEASRSGVVVLEVYDLAGRRIMRRSLGYLDVGSHSAIWSGTDSGGRSVASGVYFLRLMGGGVDITRKVAVVR